MYFPSLSNLHVCSRQIRPGSDCFMLFFPLFSGLRISGSWWGPLGRHVFYSISATLSLPANYSVWEMRGAPSAKRFRRRVRVVLAKIWTLCDIRGVGGGLPTKLRCRSTAAQIGLKDTLSLQLKSSWPSARSMYTLASTGNFNLLMSASDNVRREKSGISAWWAPFWIVTYLKMEASTKQK